MNPLTRREKLSAALGIVVFVILLGLIGEMENANAKTWHVGREASWYSLPGNYTACGRRMTKDSWWVAALKPGLAQCGRKVTLCHRGKCVRVRVLDRGAWRTDRRDWDMTKRVRVALHCDDRCTVRWKHRWT